MSSITDDLIDFANELVNPDLEAKKKYKLLKYIYKQDLSIHQLQKSRIGKSVKKCTKMEGKIKDISLLIIKKWEEMLDNYGKKREARLTHPKSTTCKTSVHINNEVTNEVLPIAGDEFFLKEMDKQTENSNQSFQDFLSESAFTKKELSRKRKYDVLNDEKKQHIEMKTDNICGDKTRVTISLNKEKDCFDKRQKNLEIKIGKDCDDNIQLESVENKNCDSNEFNELPKLNFDINTDYINQLQVYNKPKNVTLENQISEDVDVTSKYSSERKIWVPKSKILNNEVADSPEACEYINGVTITEIATYNAKQLLEFENNNKRIIRKTNEFWQKLFMKNYKSASKFDDEKWRDAYARIEAEEEAKLKKISERLNRKTEINKQNETRAKLIKEPFKPVRKFGSYRR